LRSQHSARKHPETNMQNRDLMTAKLIEEIDTARRENFMRFTLLSAAATLAAAGVPRFAHAFSLSDLSQADASSGVKTALEKGAEVAVSLLGKQDGFWGNDLVRIPLPDWIQKAERAIKLLGRGGDIDALKLGVNRAAEQAVPQAKDLLVGAVRGMSVQDAKGILTGGDDSATQFFKTKTQSPLGEKFLPIVAGVTDRIGLAKQYNELAGRVQKTGFVQLKPEQATVERHVTTKALDGLYFMIGEQEKKIRKDPVGTGSDILQRVFGAVRR
jgi:Protein of unknown function (DUF4197)